MKIFLENKKQLFAIFKQGYHIGNQSGISIKFAIEEYLLSAGYTKKTLVESNLMNNYIAIKAVANIHYSISPYSKLAIDDALHQKNELKRLRTMEEKYNIVINVLKLKTENYADLYNKDILEEINSYKNKAIPCLNCLINSFEIKEWLISLKCYLLQDKDNTNQIIKDSIFYGTKPLIY